MTLRSLAIVATRGTSNNLFQIATMVRAATALEATVQVLFDNAALLKLRLDRINLTEWSAVYAPVQDKLEERLRAADFMDMETFLREAKEHGDDVTFWASAETLASARLRLSDLTPLLDGERGRAQFLAEARSADALLTF
jgi:peroxiredoxin family protein